MAAVPPNIPRIAKPQEPFVQAVANVISIFVLASLSLVTFGYERALEPLYGIAPVQQNLNKIVWSACILGSFAPTLPVWPAVLVGGVLVSGMTYSTYWAAVYTGRMGDVIWGPVLTHLCVLAPVLYLGVAIVKALQETPERRGVVAETSAQMITLPVCRTAIMAIKQFWPVIPYTNALDETKLFSYVGGLAITLWALSPFFISPASSSTVAEPPSEPSLSSKSKKHNKTASARSPPAKSLVSNAPNEPSKNFSSKNFWRVMLLPSIPALATILQAPTLPKPLLQPYIHPTAPLRVVSSVRSPYSGIVLVGEVLPPTPEAVEAGNVTEPHSLRYLRAGHSLLGGVWMGERVYRRDRIGPVSVDQDGTSLGDSIYSTFVMQEAARLVKTSNGDSRKKALTIGLGTGIATSSFARHGLSTTIVEIDPAVYEAARRYFGLTQPVDGQVYLEDARGWVRRRRGSSPTDGANAENNADDELFDIVIHDCFSGGGVPGHIFTLEFWNDLKTIVHDDGVVAVNFAGKMGSDSSRAIITTLTKVFGQCRAFHDSMEELTEEQLNTEFINWVFFCTPTSEPIVFRPSNDADYLNSFLRERVLSTLSEREVELTKITGDIQEKDQAKYTLTDQSNPLVDWQKKDALHHWGLMRQVLPDVFWETY